MTIGIDLDGVLFDSESFYRSYAELFDIKLNREGSHDESELSIEQKYNWSAEEFQQFLDECMQHVTEDAPLKPYAKEVINLLKSRGHRLVIISARGDYREWENEKTYERLKKEGLTFDGLFLNQPNKATKCIEEKVDVMIDDSFKHVNLIAQSGIKCLYFRELPSLPANNENITEVYSWGEAYRKILALEKSIEKK